MPVQKKLTFEEKVMQALSPITKKKVIIACSGGPDSMALLDLLCHFYGKNSTKYIVVSHIHHGLRESAERDQELVRKYCVDKKLVYECLRAEVQKKAKVTKTTIEECARNIRKERLEKIRVKHRADYILTAHHADDQAETLLYRITKGTSITGLVGIEEIAQYYFRPLLIFSKKMLLDYVKKYNILYGDDETNIDTTIPRNLLRHKVLPHLKSINPKVDEALARLGKSAQELKSSFDTFFADSIAQKEFDYDWYHTLPLGFRHELLRCLYESANTSTHGFSLALLLEFDKFLATRNGGKKEFGKKWLIKKNSTIYLT